jgi:Flp pilus assembly protein TadD
MLAAGKDEDALFAMEAAVERDPHVSEGWFQKGMLHLARGEWAEALLSLERALAVDETDPRVWVAKFYALERAGGRSAEAARCLIRAADLDPLFTQQWIAKRFTEGELRTLRRRYGEGQGH